MHDLDFLEKEMRNKVSEKRASHIMSVADELIYLSKAFGLSKKETNGMLAAAILRVVCDISFCVVVVTTYKPYAIVG